MTTPEALPPRCLLCGTRDPTVTPQSLAAGAGCVCTRCGQRWTAVRLEAAAAYARYAAAR